MVRQQLGLGFDREGKAAFENLRNVVVSCRLPRDSVAYAASRTSACLNVYVSSGASRGCDQIRKCVDECKRGLQRIGRFRRDSRQQRIGEFATDHCGDLSHFPGRTDPVKSGGKSNLATLSEP